VLNDPYKAYCKLARNLGGWKYGERLSSGVTPTQPAV
jgi:hypothetical protein